MTWYILAVLGSAVAAPVDCTGYRPWSTAVVGGPPAGSATKVHYNNTAYQATTWVGATNEPGPSVNWSPWKEIGPCIDGTAKKEEAGGSGSASEAASLPEIDCLDHLPWSEKVSGSPPQGGWTKTYRDGIAYKANVWVDKSTPPGGDSKSDWSPWVTEGKCKEGTMGDGHAKDPIIDCSEYRPWTMKVSGNPPQGEWIRAYKDGLAYKSNTWVDNSTIPGAAADWSPWTYEGKCKEGTMLTGHTKETDDCSKVFAWSPYLNYAEPGTLVHDQGLLWKAKWWSNGDTPEETDTSPWAYVGKCIHGTDTQGPEQVIILPPQWILDLTCLCCEKCGTVQNGQVICTDREEEKCWYKWCGDEVGKLDEAKCTDAKNKEKFGYWGGSMLPSQKTWPKQVYAPYFDSGLYGWPPLTEIMDKYGVTHFIVAFIVSASSPILQTGECQGAFAGAISVEAGPTYEHEGKYYHLYDELNKVREKGGDFVISYGGANGIELADSAPCQKGDPVANLVSEYGRILDLTNSTRIDFDIEGNAYSAIQADKGWTYRFKAVKKLKELRPELQVFWTVPILPTGLTDDAISFFTMMMQLDAPFNLINVMNMDYGECPTICDNAHIDKCERDAIDNLVQQLFDIAKATNKLSELGWTSANDVYSWVGSTPMLGKNDITCLVYTLEAAKTNLEHWKEKKIALISNWSIARDDTCPGRTYVDVACSSYDGQTEQYEFAKIFTQYTSKD